MFFPLPTSCTFSSKQIKTLIYSHGPLAQVFGCLKKIQSLKRVQFKYVKEFQKMWGQIRHTVSLRTCKNSCSDIAWVGQFPSRGHKNFYFSLSHGIKRCIWHVWFTNYICFANSWHCFSPCLNCLKIWCGRDCGRTILNYYGNPKVY